MRATLPSIGRENHSCLPSAGRFFIRISTNSSASTQLTPWHRKVAQATPATPMWKAFTKSMSMKMLDVEEAARKKNGVRESPSAENTPVAML